jgi:hypothetical protein
MDLDGHVCPECMPAVQALLGEVESLRAWLRKLEGRTGGDDSRPTHQDADRVRQAQEPPLPQ